MLTQCPECGYSLEGLPANHKCPECGTLYDQNSEIYPWIGKRRQRFVALVGVPGFILFQIALGFRDGLKGGVWYRTAMNIVWLVCVCACAWSVWFGIRVFRSKECIATLPDYLLVRVGRVQRMKINWRDVTKIEPHQIVLKSVLIYQRDRQKPLLVQGVFESHEHMVRFIEAAQSRVEQTNQALDSVPKA